MELQVSQHTPDDMLTDIVTHKVKNIEIQEAMKVVEDEKN